MKKLLVIALMVVGSVSFAQMKGSSRDKMMLSNKTTMIEAQSQKLKSDLGLSDDQTNQIKALFVKQQQDLESVKTQVRTLKAGGQQLTQAQRSEFKTKMDAQKVAIDTQLKTILTAEQYAKWQGSNEARKIKVENKVRRDASVG